MAEVVIVGAARTPQGSFMGSLSSLPAPRLGAVAIRAALERAGIAPEKVSETIMGNVLSAGIGQAPARQASIFAGIPDSTPTATVNKVCGSGMYSVVLGARALMLGEAEVVVAGGMESMSRAPHAFLNAREGFRLGDQKAVDLMVHDGLWDPYDQQHMGMCAELCASGKHISREEQDAYAIESFKRAQKAQSEGKFNNEIAPVTIEDRKGKTTIDKDEGPGKADFDKIPKLKPVFAQTGSVTAANASTINDGAAALVLTTADKAKELGCKPLARIVSYAVHAQEPKWFTTAPIGAVPKALQKAGWSPADADLYEINEAFAVVALAAQRELNIPAEKLNVWGGAIALGHPIGASGARILVTLISTLRDRNLKRGVAGICIGGGEALAMCVERV